MIKTITAIAAAAFIAAIVVVFPGATPAVSANTPDQAGAQQPALKSDRLAVRALGAACSPRAWPYYDRDCLFEGRWHGETRSVRVVTTDRIDTKAR
jgi:hypothetical protein